MSVPALLRSYWVFLWLSLTIATVVRLSLVLVYDPLTLPLLPDAQRHLSHVVYKGLNAAYDPIGYQLFLHAAWEIGKRSGLVISAALLSVATPWVWYLFMRRVFPQNRYQALLATNVIAWFPPWIGVFSHFMAEALLLPLLGLGCYATSRLKTSANADWRHWLLADGVWIAAIITKAIALPLALVSLGYELWNSSRSHRFRRCLSFASLLLLVLVPIAIRNYQISGFVAPLGFNLPHAINVQSGYMGVQFRVNYEKDRQGQTFVRNPSNVSLINPLQKHGLETELHLLGYPMDLEQSSLGPSFREVAPFHEPTCKLFTLDWKEDWLRIYQEHKARGWQGFLVWLDNMRFFFVGLPNPEYRLRVPFFDAWTVWMSHNYVWPIAFGLCCLGNLVYFQRQRRLPYIAILAMVGWFCCIFSDIVSESRYHKPLEIFLVINAMWLFLRRQELALPRFRWRLPGPEKLPD